MHTHTHSHAIMTMQDGYTCLHVAADQGNLETVQFLVEQGGQELLLSASEVCQRANAYAIFTHHTNTHAIFTHHTNTHAIFTH
jgi:hypothetical protein